MVFEQPIWLVLILGLQDFLQAVNNFYSASDMSLPLYANGHITVQYVAHVRHITPSVQSPELDVPSIMSLSDT